MASRLWIALVWGLVPALLSGCSSAGPEPDASSATATADPATESGSAAVRAEGVVRYLALGDSVTSGEGVLPEESYPGRLAALWRAGGCDVVLENVAVTGYKSADVLVDQLPVASTFEPTLVTLMVGGNDIANGVGIDEYRRNVRSILEQLDDSGATIVTISQQFWDRTPVGQGYGTRDELTAKRTAFDAVLVEEGLRVGAKHVDLRQLFDEQAQQEMWLEDELHPTAAAYEGWAAALFEDLDDPCAA